ncbi:MAG: hypothetical protein CBD47_05030, partial [Synechococcus sp. TMED187]
MSLHLDELIQLVSCPLPNLMELQLADLNAQLTHAEQRRLERTAREQRRQDGVWSQTVEGGTRRAGKREE